MNSEEHHSKKSSSSSEEHHSSHTTPAVGGVAQNVASHIPGTQAHQVTHPTTTTGVTPGTGAGYNTGVGSTGYTNTAPTTTTGVAPGTGYTTTTPTTGYTTGAVPTHTTTTTTHHQPTGTEHMSGGQKLAAAIPGTQANKEKKAVQQQAAYQGSTY